MRRKTESEDFSTKRMQELPYDVRPHLMSYLPAEGLCRLIETRRSFSEDLPQRDVRKLSFFFALALIENGMSSFFAWRVLGYGEPTKKSGVTKCVVALQTFCLAWHY